MMRILRAAPTLLRIGLADAFAYRAEFLVWVLTTTDRKSTRLNSSH